MLKKFFKNISNIRISKADSITPPIEFIKKYPVTKEQSNFIVDSRKQVADIINGKDDRLLVVVGPCSIHDIKAAKEYANRLLKVKKKFDKELFIVMRVYFEKPRTTIGWRGLIYDPDLDNSFKMEKGFDLARGLLLYLTKMNIPSATEYLDLITPQYIADLISWGAIGARTTESQIHRELASGLSCPVGFKNGTDGNIKIAVDAMYCAARSHMFWSINKKGKVYRYTTSGNNNCHIILRGGKGKPNYQKKYVEKAIEQLKENNLLARVMVDFSHSNSLSDFKNQILIADDIVEQIKDSDNIFGVMIESHLNEGKQKVNKLSNLKYGVSITDSCLGWEDTTKIIEKLAKAVKEKRKNK
jgi:3-deoxy-7-phosphoheptulonate synthase